MIHCRTLQSTKKQARWYCRTGKGQVLSGHPSAIAQGKVPANLSPNLYIVCMVG